MKSDSWREALRRWQMSSCGTAQEDQAPHMLCEKLDAAGDGSAALDSEPRCQVRGVVLAVRALA